MIDDGPSSNQGGQMGPNSGYGMNSKQSFDEHTARMDYNMPGILHFLQTEWAKFEMERAQWDVERAELQARIAFLQGERKGQENLKQDLVRRIKMLEFALRQERAKYQKLQYGVEQTQQQQAVNNGTQSSEDEYEDSVQTNSTTGPTYRQGRQLLKQYLEEIGYTDALLDVRSSRVRSLLGIHTDKDDHHLKPESGSESSSQQPTQSLSANSAAAGMIITAPSIKSETAAAAAAMLDQDNTDVMKVQLQYLPQTAGTVVDDADDSDEEDDSQDDGDDDDDDLEERRRIAESLPGGGSSSTGGGAKLATGIEDDEEGLDDEEEALAEFDFLVSENSADDGRTDGDGSEWAKNTDWPLDQQRLNMQIEQYKKERIHKKHDHSQRPKKHDLQAMIATLGSDDSASDETDGGGRGGEGGKSSSEMMMRFPPGASLDRQLEAAALGLGDLADITVANDEAENVTQFDIAGAADANTRKTWNAKYTLRSHFDGVRALTFHPVEPVLLTASEDHTMKLWNLQKTVPTKKATALDVEPVYTFRAHQGPVLCLAMSATGEECFSGGVDSTIRCWNLPSSNIDPYDSYDSSILQDTLVAHTDAVWGLAIHSTRVQLLSCSADGTVRLWSPGIKMQLNKTYLPPNEDDGVPTGIDFLASDPNHMMAAYSSGNVYVFDLSTGQQVVKFNTQPPEAGVSARINKLISHPTLPVAISAHEDRSIRFFDSTSGQAIDTMVAHLDAVTSLAVDPNGLYLLSGSHDCSIRLWSMETKTCVQEITSHRKKFDESIFDVAFHPSKPYIASAGADGVAKVLV